MKIPAERLSNQSIQQARRTAAAQRLAKNREASEDYVKTVYPNEKFLSRTTQLQAANQWTKKLVLPRNVRLAESRIPRGKDQCDILKKELHQAGKLSRLGNSIFFTPERGGYKKRVTDAVINGVPFEFRNITGKPRRIESEFGDAKKKGKGVNVFINIESDIGKDETRRRIGLVLNRHQDYTGKIIVSFQDGKIYFWDSSSFR